MTMKKNSTITCPDCGFSVPMVIYESINVSLDLEGRVLKSKLLNGELLTFKCPKCGRIIETDYPILYHDMDKCLMIWNVPIGFPGEKQRLDEIYAIPEKPGYITRLVGSREELVEKISLFDHGIDDRVLEICKQFLWRDLKQQYADANSGKRISAICTCSEEDNIIGSVKFLYTYDNQTKYIKADLSTHNYDCVKKDWGKEIEQLPLRSFDVVNMGYGRDVVELRYKAKPAETSNNNINSNAEISTSKPLSKNLLDKYLMICTECGAIYEGKPDECKSCSSLNLIELPISIEEWKNNIAKHAVWALKYMELYCYPSSNFKYDKWIKRVTSHDFYNPDAGFFNEISTSKCPKCNSKRIVKITKKGLIKPKSKKCLDCASEF